MDCTILQYAMYNHECLSLPLVNYAKFHFGWTALQFSSIAYLKRFGKLSMSELARDLFVSKQQATQLVSSLVKHGLAKRLQNENNRRIIYVSATDLAVKQLIEAETAFIESVKVQLFTCSEPERQQLLNAMRLLVNFVSTNGDALLRQRLLDSE